MEPIRQRESSLVNGHASTANRPSVSQRLRSIDSAMTWIRDELEELKESDRSLMEIFKQLQGDVADLNVYVQSWRYSSVSSRDSYLSEGRPVSASDLDFHILDEPDDEQEESLTESVSVSIQSLESTLTSSREAVKTRSETHLAPDADSGHGSSTYSPVLSSQGQTTSAYSTNKYRMSPSLTTSNIVGAKGATPQLKSSVSLNKISSASPITRLQDETSSVTSRHSSESIDSGVQIENGSANGVEATNTTQVTSMAEPEGSATEFGDFATDVLSMFGFRT